jgi:hydrogenase-4 component E
VDSWVDAAMLLLILTSLLQLGSSRLAVGIRTVAYQGAVLAFLPFLLNPGRLTIHTFLLAVGVLGLRSVGFPALLFRALRDANVRREVEPFVGHTTSLVAGVLALIVSLWIASRVRPTLPTASSLLVPTSLFLLLVGLLLIVTRRKAITQVVGYLVIENGLYVFGMAIAVELPWLVELGILLDAFVAVFLMGISVYHISQEFDHIDVDQLSTLKG